MQAIVSTIVDESVAAERTTAERVTNGRHATSWAGTLMMQMVFGSVLTLLCEAANPAEPSHAWVSTTDHGPRHPGEPLGVHLLVAAFHTGIAPSTGGVVLS